MEIMDLFCDCLDELFDCIDKLVSDIKSKIDVEIFEEFFIDELY